jgi:two-component system chemotaxis response regulator CheY
MTPLAPGCVVLVVDDDPFIRKLILTTLEDVAGVRLEEAGDGVEALRKARATQPAVVFLDVQMPRMDGLEACRELRRLPGGETTTIVMLTAAGAEAADGARVAGADLFLTKPFSPLDLLHLVDELSPQAR